MGEANFYYFTCLDFHTHKTNKLKQIMARFQTVERPSETVTKLIQNSVAKLKNKEGRVKGRRSKGVPQGLLHQVLVKGVIKDLVKVVNKETRFPKEISTKNNNGAAANFAQEVAETQELAVILSDFQQTQFAE